MLSLRATHSVTVAVGSVLIGVAFTSAAAFQQFSFELGDLVANGKPHYHFYVVDNGTETLFWSQPDQVRSWAGDPLPASVIAFLAENALMNDFFMRGEYIGFHAAVVRGLYSAAMLVGATTAGKTTTSIACVQRGLRFYSDERGVLLDGYVYPFPRALTVREGGCRMLLDDVDSDSLLWEFLHAAKGHVETTVRPSMIFGERVGGAPERLGSLLLIEGASDRPTLREAPLYDLLPQIAPNAWTAATGLERVARIMSALQNVRCYRLQLGRPSATARLIAELMSV